MLPLRPLRPLRNGVARTEILAFDMPGEDTAHHVAVSTGSCTACRFHTPAGQGRAISFLSAAIWTDLNDRALSRQARGRCVRDPQWSSASVRALRRGLWCTQQLGCSRQCKRVGQLVGVFGLALIARASPNADVAAVPGSGITGSSAHTDLTHHWPFCVQPGAPSAAATPRWPLCASYDASEPSGSVHRAA